MGTRGRPSGIGAALRAFQALRAFRVLRALLPTAVALLALMSTPAPALIDARFTPVDLVRQSQVMFWGSLSAGPGADEWTLTTAETFKGAGPKQAVLSLARCDRDQVAAIRQLARPEGGGPALLAVVRGVRETRACLSAGGTWLALAPAGADRWEVTGTAPRLSGVYAGGTDMLIRLVRNLLADPDLTVPTSAGITWLAERANLGVVRGELAGMEAVELPGDAGVYLLVGSAAGDRLFRARDQDEAFEDVTERARLDTRSRRFAWMDDANGPACLLSWDGAALRRRAWSGDGTLSPAAGGESIALPQPCLGLAACRLPGGRPAAIVTTADRPLLLAEGPPGRWQLRPLPDGPALARAGPGACAAIVADLDNDGYWDVLQPRRAGGALWRGTAAGLAAPVASPVACPDEGAGVAVGDFDQDGCLDVFLAGRKGNELWENDGRGGFRAVSALAGSLAYKSPAGLIACRVADLNHDGRLDLCLLHPQEHFTYHFNRGFRCFSEEGEVRLERPAGATGQAACAVADFNGDGALDLAVAFADGHLRCYYNDAFNTSLVRLGLAKGMPGPVTVSLWQGPQKLPRCTGAVAAAGGGRTWLALPRRGPCTLRWQAPGRPPRSRELRPQADRTRGGPDVWLDP